MGVPDSGQSWQALAPVGCHPSDSEGARVTEQRESEPTGWATSAVTTLVGPGTPVGSYFIIRHH